MPFSHPHLSPATSEAFIFNFLSQPGFLLLRFDNKTKSEAELKTKYLKWYSLVYLIVYSPKGIENVNHIWVDKDFFKSNLSIVKP